MKRSWLAAFLVLSLVWLPGVRAFDVSPTQMKAAPDADIDTRVGESLLDAVFADERLLAGTELFGVTPDGQRLWTMQGQLSAPVSGDLEQAARAFIEAHAAMFNLPAQRTPALLETLRDDASTGARHFAFQMQHDGLPVRDATIEVHIGKDRRIQLVHGSLPTLSTIANTRRLGDAGAIARARQVIGVTGLRAPATAKPEIVASPDGRGRHAWAVRLPAANPLGDFEIVVDAESGAVLHRSNEMPFAHTGKGSVYVTHPLTSPVTVEPLPNLTTTTLTGLYATVDNEDGPESVSSESEHVYDPDHTHFDEVNMYFHLNRIHDYYKGMGFNKLDRPIKAVVHYGTNYDNAFFSPWQGILAFGDGNKFNDLAKEESIAYHEYSHMVVNAIVSLTYSKESGAINEGQADYFACTVSDDPKLGEWACAKMGKPYLRILVNDLHYPEDIQGEVHADGKIWGAVLWDIRTAIGAEVADRLIHKSFSYLKAGSPKFIDGYTALVTADKNLNDGANAEALAAVMKKRGIIASAYKGAYLTGRQLKQMKKFREVHAD